MDELKGLLSLKHTDLKPWVIGKIPAHFKRISASPEEALELAKLGMSKVFANFGDKLFFTQSLFTGSMLCKRYKEIVIVSCSQWGKSWSVARASIILASEGEPVYIAGATEEKTKIIMAHVIAALQTAAPEIRNKLLVKSDQLARLAHQVSKQRLGFSNGGFIEPITLGSTYQDIARNKAVGRSGWFLVDEAALVDEDSFAEMGRREFSNITGEAYPMVLISNPHNPGTFYEKLTQDDPPDNTFILWMDALTAVEEERFSEIQVLESEFARRKSTRTRYLMCELEESGTSMFEEPKVYDHDEGSDRTYFLGIDSAYKGKDDLTLALASIDEDHFIRVEDILVLDTSNWVKGATAEQLVRDIVRIVRKQGIARTCIDIGQGIWLNEKLREHHVNVGDVHFGQQPTPARVKNNHYAAKNAANARAEMHLDLQALIEDGRIAFKRECYDAIKDALPFITYQRKPNGKIEIRKKSEIKRSIGHSPDALDAVLLAIHAIVQFQGI